MYTVAKPTGEESHVFLHEQAGAAQLAGVSLHILPNNEDGTFDLKSLESAIRKDEIHEPISKLIIIENTFNGKFISLYKSIKVLLYVPKNELAN